MIVSPDKGVFFLATALMCSATLYAAELSSRVSDPMTRVFVGEPNQLTLPPGFPGTDELSANLVPCVPRLDLARSGPALHTASASAVAPDAEGCGAQERAEPAAVTLPLPLTSIGTNGPSSTSPTASLSTAVRTP